MRESLEPKLMLVVSDVQEEIPLVVFSVVTAYAIEEK